MSCCHPQIAVSEERLNHTGNEQVPTVRRMTAFACDTAPRRPGMSSRSRVSIDRYLSAPLSDEPASPPAISAALRNQPSSYQLSSPTYLGHSANTSVDIHSEGHRTFFTSGSAYGTADTVYTQDSRTKPSTETRNRFDAHNSDRWMPVDHGRGNLPPRPTTSGAIAPTSCNDMAREWADRVERIVPRRSEDHDRQYRSRATAAAEAELLVIQEKARELEAMLHQYRQGHGSQPYSPKLTNASAHAMMAANPKLAWVLGDDAMDTRSVVRPKSTVSTVNELERPKTAHGSPQSPSGKFPRRNKSIGALFDEHDDAAPSPTLESFVDQYPVKRTRYHCTFCLKRFNGRLEWLRHERAVHVRDELWVCCPRIGKFPARCPFCSRNHPSPAHLADHNYISCQEKPLSERTFANKDQFLQHISQMHKIDPGQKPARLTELIEAWKQPLPMNIGHKALHCGFCGMVFKTYEERTTHVGRHFFEGVDIMSWWGERVSHMNVDSPEQRIITPNGYVRMIPVYSRSTN